MMWLLNAFLQGLLKSAYGNVVFFSFENVLPLQTSHAFLFTFAHSCRKSHVLYIFPAYVDIFVRFCAYALQSESSWYTNGILQCFLRAVYGNVVFSRSKMKARHKCLTRVTTTARHMGKSVHQHRTCRDSTAGIFLGQRGKRIWHQQLCSKECTAVRKDILAAHVLNRTTWGV